MADSGASFNRPYKPFGLNVKVPERTLKQVGDTLGNVAKALGVHRVKVLENGLGKNIGMQLGYTVDGMRAHAAQVCQTNLSVSENTHFRNSVPISGEC